MESSSSSPIVFESPGFLRVFEDGRVERLIGGETVPPSSEDDNFDEEKEGVASKDVVLDPQTGVFARLYLPRLHVTDGRKKFPVLVYVHGGGFCIESAASPGYHSYLNKVATEAKVIGVSVEYRRAPEYRLPAAYDDCFGVLEWLDHQAMAVEGVSVDPWLASHADFSKVFIAGDSAGANIVHQVGIRASGRNWDGLCLQGAILVHPFFGGEERIESELGAEVEGFVKAVDGIWSISLPVGANRDHPFCNPVGPRSLPLSTLVFSRTLVFVAEKDLLRDRGILYYEALKKAGKDVDFVMTEGEDHVFHLLNPKSEKAPLLMKRISDMSSAPSIIRVITDNKSMACFPSAIFVTVVVMMHSLIAVSASCIFIFGDSLVDTGNNNHITTLARADIWYNGIDFANRFPTGRFCNGRTVPDFLAQIMGLSIPIPYLDPQANGTNLLGGVNFASGGSGILPSTGYKYIGRTPFDRQIEYFEDIKTKLASMMDPQAESSHQFISEALFYINIGSLDYISNYFLRDSKVSQLYSAAEYQQLLLRRFGDQFKKIYELGARKFLISNLGPLGCTPLMISLENLDNGSCVGYANGIISDFNRGLENMVRNKLQNQFSDARFVLSDNYAIFSEIINNPSAYGFKYVNESCCGLGHLRAEFPCSPIAGLCFHRGDYVFWDAFHPTEALNAILAATQYAGSPQFIRPVNLKQLMNIM